MNIIRFYSQTYTILPDGDDKFRKRALVAIEGTQEDCDGNKHELPKERLSKIVENTNNHLKKFRMYLIKDHNFKSSDVLGVVTGNFIGKTISEKDLPDDYAKNPDIYKELIGKYGVFCDRLDLFESDFADKISKGLNGISMGLAVDDNNDEKIIEISLTPAPAIPHMRLFTMNLSNYKDLNMSATSWLELDRTDKKTQHFETEFEKLASQLYLLIENIRKNESTYIVSAVDINQKLVEILNGFASRVIKLYQNTYFGVDNVNPLDASFQQPRGQAPNPHQAMVNNMKINEILRTNGRYFSKSNRNRARFNLEMNRVKGIVGTDESVPNSSIVEKLIKKYGKGTKEITPRNEKDILNNLKARIILGEDNNND